MKKILLVIAIFISANSYAQIDSTKLKTSVSMQVRDWLYFNSFLKNNHDFENVYDSVKAKLRVAVNPALTTVIKVDSVRNIQIIRLAQYIKQATYGSVIFVYTRVNNALRSTPYLIRKIDEMDQTFIDQYNQAVQNEIDDLRSVLIP